MNFNNLPSKKEVMGWNPQSLADYMRKLNLSGCDKAVMKSSMSGAQFMKLTEGDLHVFPVLFVPVISKIQSQISKGEQMKAFGHKPKTQMLPQQAFAREEEVWDSDEFDNESDREDEALQQHRRGDGYICALTESHDTEEVSSDEYEIPSKDPVKPPQHPRAAKHPDSNNRGNNRDSSPTERVLRPPLPCPKKSNNATKRPPKAPATASQPSQPVDRSKKPRQPASSKNDIKKSKGSTVKSLTSSFRKASKPKPPTPSEVSSRTSKPTPAPPVPPQAAKMNSPPPEPRQSTPDLDPSWYGGQMTRHQAEEALRDVNEDGAFLVRDSSKSSEEHPYTLMLLKQDKVFNIKIRNQGNSYSLGNGLNNKSFPGVREMITHHTHTPLLLIDATDQSSEAHNHCCLLHPAGF
ncbi:lymphocyte cytosolic protein 2 [Halichoeres trimaculatus]|uniref:lymphocyte cytosolic protein 2 n=1 Tax=Halichoeres trimaculatus TaxID=147232 RepID=UPI003D9FA397